MAPSRRPSRLWHGPVGWFFLAALFVLAWLAPVPVRADLVGYQPDYDLEDQMDRVKARGYDCLPDSYSIQVHPFWTRVAAKVFDTCLDENLTEEQIVKYMALGAGSLSPAGVYIAPYTASELKSDGVKCLMKAYVEASGGMSRAEKDNWRGNIDTGFAVKDWHGFITSISEFADPDAKKVTHAFFDFSLAAYERRAEAGSFTQALIAASQQSWRDVNIYVYGELPVVLEEYDQLVNECRYDQAGAALERADKLAERECRALGHQYRLIEQELVSTIYRNWEIAKQEEARFEISNARIVRQTMMNDMKRDLAAAKAALLDYVEGFENLEKRDKALEKLVWGFEKEQDDYFRQLTRTRAALDTPAACYAIGALRDLLADKTGACRAAFFRGRLAGHAATPEAVEQELFAIASRKSARWWGEVEEIRTLFNTCREGEGFSRIGALKGAVQANPIVVATADACKPLEQPVLMQVLDSFAPLPHCRKTTVPEIEGEALATAADMLAEAELVIGGKVEKVAPKQGQTPGVVLKSDPRPGSSARVWSGVKLTIVDKFPEAEDEAEEQEEQDEEQEQELVEMPKVLGLSEAAARGAVSDAGLTPVINKGKLADKIEMKPGHVYHADYKAGDKLAPKTRVVMTRYGPRPMVKVPAIAGTDLEAAKGILSAAGFTPGAPAAGEAPPADKNPGEIYESLPASGTEQEKFTTVQPLVYGLRPAAPLDEVAEPEEEPEADEPEVTEGSWIGRWRISGTHVNSSGGKQRIRGVMEIAPEGDMLMLKWSTQKDGKLKEVATLPVAVGEDNALRLHPKALRELDAADSGSGGGSGGDGGVFGREVGKVAAMFKEALKTLVIARDGDQCAITVRDPEKGPMTITVGCVREGGGSP